MQKEEKIKELINVCWRGYKYKVASGMLNPENEKMMQLQFSLLLQTLAPAYEFYKNESIKILLEEPVTIKQINRKIIDIVILHSIDDIKTYYPIELKCFREYTRDGSGKKRGAQNLGMYDYWTDIENIEQYSYLPYYGFGTQLTITDDMYYVNGKHRGLQVITYSTNVLRDNISGVLECPIASRCGKIQLKGSYTMELWDSIKNFSFIKQHYDSKL